MDKRLDDVIFGDAETAFGSSTLQTLDDLELLAVGGGIGDTVL